MEYDLVVVGAGPGGTPAAMAAAQFGKKVLLVDKRGEPGGECLFEGCIPSKILENAANRYAFLKDAKKFGVELDGVAQIHWDEVLAQKAQLIEHRAKAALAGIERLPNLDFIGGEATFVNANTIEVDGTRYAFKNAIIATGAHAHLPPFKGSGVAKAWTNEDIFVQKEIPKEIAFIGGGAISCELVQMFAKLGTKCYLLERGERILRKIDEDAALIVQERMKRSGVEVLCNVSIDSIEEGFTINYTQDGEAKSLQVANVVIATGREPNVEGLGLENIGVEYDRHGIVTNEQLQTSLPHIYATGDCNQGPKFAHWASYEAGIAVHNIFAPFKRSIEVDKLSWCLFSDPQIAQAGIDEQSAAKRGIDVTVQKYDYKVDARAQIDKDTEGFVKFIIDKSSDKIIGAQVVSYDASSLSGEAALIVSQKMSVQEVMGAIHPHPTLTEGFGKLAQALFFASMARR